MARTPRAQQGNEADKAAQTPQQGNEADAGPPPSELEGFIHWAEMQGGARNTPVTRLSHPEVKAPRHWDGRFGGFPMEPGEPAVTWSDGERFPA